MAKKVTIARKAKATTTAKAKRVARKPARKKKVTPIPKGYPAISAYLVVEDVKKAADLYQKAFGFKMMGKPMEFGGRVVHANLKYRDSVFMLGCPQPDGSHASPKAQGVKQQGFGLFAYVANVDAHYSKVKRYKGLSTTKPETMFWGDRVYDVVDRDGHRWSFASRVEKKTPKQMADSLKQMMAAAAPK